MERICYNCRKSKSLDKFYRNAADKLGRTTLCIDCTRLKRKVYYLENKESCNHRTSQYHKKHRDKLIIKQREYHQTHRNEARDYMRTYFRERRQGDPSFRILDNLRNRVNKTLRGNTKSNHTIDLIGCSITELRTKLEAQFKTGMNWENYGRNGWHIDHIRPCSSFDLSYPEEQKKCFHWTNLQPLWAAENLQKHNSFHYSKTK